MTELSHWVNFYVIVGSSAGALIGLQFVVITLIADFGGVQGDAERAGSAFATPTIVHFGAVLLLAAVISAPWRAVTAAAIVIGLMGLCGLIYTAIVARRARQQTAYNPELEDWLFHVAFPFAAYATLGISSWAAHSHQRGALFSIAVAALLLLGIGIHNAWDAVTYYVFVRQAEQKKAPHDE